LKTEIYDSARCLVARRVERGGFPAGEFQRGRKCYVHKSANSITACYTRYSFGKYLPFFPPSVAPLIPAFDRLFLSESNASGSLNRYLLVHPSIIFTHATQAGKEKEREREREISSDRHELIEAPFHESARFDESAVAPAGVTITGPTEAKADDQVLIVCTTENSNPPADIKWTVDGHNFESNASKTEPASNGGWITSSNVTFSINRKSRSIVVICHASNVKLTENVVGTHTINVICKGIILAVPLLCSAISLARPAPVVTRDSARPAAKTQFPARVKEP
jgi:hypothetical protein